MLTKGRIRAIIVNGQRTQSIEVLRKYCGELQDEVMRLRGVLINVAREQSTPMDAQRALQEPDRGMPDFICTRQSIQEQS